MQPLGCYLLYGTAGLAILTKTVMDVSALETQAHVLFPHIHSCSPWARTHLYSFLLTSPADSFASSSKDASLCAHCLQGSCIHMSLFPYTGKELAFLLTFQCGKRSPGFRSDWFGQVPSAALVPEVGARMCEGTDQKRRQGSAW